MPPNSPWVRQTTLSSIQKTTMEKQKPNTKPIEKAKTEYEAYRKSLGKTQEVSNHHLPNLQEAKARSIKKFRRRKSAWRVVLSRASTSPRHRLLPRG